MTTTVEVSTDQLAEVQAASREPDPQAAVRIAMEEYVNNVRRLQLQQLSGRVQMDDNWRQLEAREIAVQQAVTGS